MAKAKELPSGKWRALVFAGTDINGKRKYKSFTALTERKANLLALEWQEKYKAINDDSSNMTLREAMEDYINNRDGVLSPSTVRGYDGIMRNNLQGIMFRKLNSITDTLIKAAINEEAKKYSPKTVANIYGFLSDVLKEYYPNLVFRATLPQPIPYEPQMPTTDKIAELIKSIEGDSAEIYILLALWLGLRRSEIEALKWKNVSFENNTIFICEALVPNRDNQWVLKGTKTVASTRTLSAPTYIIDKLKEIPHTSDRVVTISGRTALKYLQMHCEELDMPKITIHNLRHVMASVAELLRIGDKYTMERGGWSSDYTMKKIYKQTFKNIRTISDDSIDNFFENLIKEQ